jgi:ubiquinone/menaquinone biosynthesis C-methylase UbiE
MTARLADREPPILPAYRSHAHDYDVRTSAFQYWRSRIVDLVPKDPGATVIDVGCGTGLCFEALRSRIGPCGTLIGVDQSADMLTLASERVAAAGWDDVQLIQASAENVVLPAIADHVVFCAVHDVLRSDAALTNILRQSRSSGTVVAGGGKFASDYAVLFNALIRTTHEPYVVDFSGFDRPWSRLANHVDDLRVSEVAMGGGFLATGRVPRR